MQDRARSMGLRHHAGTNEIKGTPRAEVRRRWRTHHDQIAQGGTKGSQQLQVDRQGRQHARTYVCCAWSSSCAACLLRIVIGASLRRSGKCKGVLERVRGDCMPKVGAHQRRPLTPTSCCSCWLLRAL